MKKPRTVLAIFLLMMPIIVYGAGEKISLKNACDYSGRLINQEVSTFEPDSDTEKAINAIVKASGLAQNFQVRAAGVNNAAATIIGHHRYILYNQYFMRSVQSKTGTKWGPISILAHEIGHHLNAHTLDGKGSRPNKELEADRYSGFILQKLGASIEESRAAMSSIASTQGSFSHPPRHDRLAAIDNGWIASCERDSLCNAANDSGAVACSNGDATHKAAAKGNYNFVKECLRSGFNVNSREKNGWTPLHSASRNGHLNVVQLLLASGASINATDKTGRTPADQAKHGKKYNVLKYLTKQGGRMRK